MTPQNVLDLTREGLLLVFWVTLPVVRGGRADRAAGGAADRR